MNHLIQQLALPLQVPNIGAISLDQYRQVLQLRYDGDLSCIETTKAYAKAVKEGFQSLPICVHDCILNFFSQSPSFSNWNSRKKYMNTDCIIAAIKHGYKTIDQIVQATRLCLATVKTRIRELVSNKVILREKIGYSFVYSVAYQQLVEGA